MEVPLTPEKEALLDQLATRTANGDEGTPPGVAGTAHWAMTLGSFTKSKRHAQAERWLLESRSMFAKKQCRLSVFQPFELDAVSTDLGEIVVGLLNKPSRCVTAEDFRQPHRHLGRNSAPSIHQLR